MLTWLPLAVWAFLQGHALPGAKSEPLLAHFGVNVRCLVAIPLLILAEGVSLKATIKMAKQFVRNGIVTEAQQDRFMTLLRDAARRRDSSLPWIIVLGLTVMWILADPADSHAHDLSWAVEAGKLGFGGWWFAYVARPIFIALLAGWLWRIVLAFLLFHGISKLELSLVPSHPDRAAGLGFLEYYPKSYGLLTFAVAAVVASGWGHDVVYHAHDVHALVRPLAALIIVWLLLLLSPLLVFAPRLMAAKLQGKEDYGRIVGEHGRLVRQRWILNQKVPDEELLEIPGIGSIADANAMYDAVTQMRIIPISKGALIGVLVPLLIPALAVFAIQIPVQGIAAEIARFIGMIGVFSLYCADTCSPSRSFD
ncbi:MAG: hypothetical protein ACU88J_10740 [Gammaproteobacteria bacterium]